MKLQREKKRVKKKKKEKIIKKKKIEFRNHGRIALAAFMSPWAASLCSRGILIGVIKAIQ